MLFLWILDSSLHNEIRQNLLQLLTISVTLLAAGIATLGVLHTVDQQEIHRREERNDYLRAAKAVLPLTLLELSRVMLRGAEIRLNSEYESKKSDELLHEVTVDPEILQKYS